MNPPTRRTRLDDAAAGVRSAAFIAAGFGVTGINGVCHGAYRLRFGSHGVPGRVRYQATVAATAAASGVPAVPNAAWYLLVSRTKGSSN